MQIIFYGGSQSVNGFNDAQQKEVIVRKYCYFIKKK